MKKKSPRLDVSPISQIEIEASGARPRHGEAPKERGDDLLSRHLQVPNRMMILYSSEDSVLSKYLTDNWAALDSLSANVCDIYPSLLKLSGGEDVYSYIRELKNIPGNDTIRLDKLPIILMWSNYTSISISLRELSDDAGRVRSLLRDIFQFLHECGGPIYLKHESAFRTILNKSHPGKNVGRSFALTINGSVSMTSNKADRGGVVLGKKARSRDIKTSYTEQIQSIDLIRLASELSTLRKAMKEAAKAGNGGDEAESDVAIGNIAAAEAAAKTGERGRMLASLKAAGKWALKVAEEIGVEVAKSAITNAMGA